MAETDFILSPDEQLALMEFLLAQDVEFVPSLDYASKEFWVLGSSAELLALIRKRKLTGLVFLPKRDSRPYKFELRHVVKNDRDIYYISARLGTPCMDFSPCIHRLDSKPLNLDYLSWWHRF